VGLSFGFGVGPVRYSKRLGGGRRSSGGRGSADLSPGESAVGCLIVLGMLLAGVITYPWIGA
jgi:hypothetical protein